MKDMVEQKTNICCLNAPKSVVEYLQGMHNVYDGKLGARIDLTNVSGYSHYIAPHTDFPINDQEYDIFVVDLYKTTPIPYKAEEHERQYVEDGENYFFFCQLPQTIYDLMPYGAYLLKRSLEIRDYSKESKQKPPIVIIFQEVKYTTNYQFVNKLSESSYRNAGTESQSNYSFAESLPFAQPLTGYQIEIENDTIAKWLFSDLENKLTYHQTFSHPSRLDWETGEYVPNPNVHPLLTNGRGGIISLIQGKPNEPLFIVLPQADDETKKEIIVRLFEQVLYEYFDEYFPVIKNAKWIKEAMRSLPEMQAIEREAEKLNSEYAAKQEQLAIRKEDVLGRHEFLRQLITATGGELVQAMIQYLEWLGFEKVIDKDKDQDGKLEEDIQVDMGEQGLIVMEVKGINGTSKDSECSQVDKIRDKRKGQNENKGREVYALYVVNHQRRKAPSERLLIPFNEDQIAGTVSARRGMMSTWQLFNIACAIEMGVISKEQVRSDMLQHGAIAFEPDLVQPLNNPIHEWKNGTIIGVDVNTPISVGDAIFVEKDFQWHKAEVISLRQGDAEQQEVAGGEAGIGLSQRLPKGKWYVKHNI